jgi:hypothetical protein
VTSSKKHLALALEGEQAGTVLGAVAWVLGALEIMKDRGHAEGDERFHDLYDTLEPRLQALIAKVSGARMAMGSEEALQDEIEAAYAPMREAFETWISLTASDTLSAAVGQRLGDAFDAAEEADAED